MRCAKVGGGSQVLHVAFQILVTVSIAKQKDQILAAACKNRQPGVQVLHLMCKSRTLQTISRARRRSKLAEIYDFGDPLKGAILRCLQTIR